MKESYWIIKHKKKKQYPTLCSSMESDVVIVGGGLTGISCAYYLSKTLSQVMVLEADHIGYGASGRNTGKVTAQHGLIYKTLSEQYDRYIANQYYHANMEALASIEEIIENHQIDCDFRRCDAMLYTNDRTMCEKLQEEYQMYQSLGIASSYVEKADVPFPMEAGLIMHHQASFDPYAYVTGLADAAEKQGVRIYENSPMKYMKRNEDGSYNLIVNGHHVHAKDVILATHFPFIDHAQMYFARMICEQETIFYTPYHEKNALQDLMCLCVDSSLHSVNYHKEHLLLGCHRYISGRIPSQSQEEVKKEVMHLYQLPMEIHDGWTSSDYTTFDHLPFIGKLDQDSDHIFFASGFGKWGNTTSNIAGKLICAYVLDQHSFYQSLYHPQRFSSLFQPAFVKENLKIAYEFIKSKLKSADETFPARGEGKPMQIDHHTYGVYCDDHDELFIVDITCPHVGCVCQFQKMDKTWDCPCHGSRFSYRGDIIRGPASHRLHTYGEGLNTIDPHIFSSEDRKK